MSPKETDDGFKWKVSCYYGSVKLPKIEGELAIETLHKTSASKDIEVQTARNRDDIGSIVVSRVNPKTQFAIERRKL